MNHDKVTLTYSQALLFLSRIRRLPCPMETDFRKNTIILYNEHDQKQVKYNYPLILNLTESVIKDENLLNNYIHNKPLFAHMLIQAGNAALGLHNGDTFLQHKVIRKYMTRKKQGKAQLTYLKTKGKSRAGSRIRLANSVLFFEEINQTLADWDIPPKSTIIYSCGPMLWGMLFKSKTAAPFSKKDHRLKKLPLNIDVPNFDILIKAVHYSQQGFIDFLPGCREALKKQVLDILELVRTEKYNKEAPFTDR